MESNNLKEYQLLYDLSDYYSQIIANRIVKWLQRLKGSCLLSGDESGLENTWDEICVQVQDETWMSWDIHKYTIRSRLVDEIESEPLAARNLLSYMSEDYDNCEPGYNPESAIKLVYKKLMAMADNQSNKRIKHYLEIRS